MIERIESPLSPTPLPGGEGLSPEKAIFLEEDGDKKRTTKNAPSPQGIEDEKCAAKKAPLPQGEGLGRGDTQLDFAKYLRSHQTDAEQRLWYHLRAHRFMNLKFKRQRPIGRYIVDFVCLEYRLIIEADGGQHGDEADQLRDIWLKTQGFTILRFWNHEILQQTEAVLERIRGKLLELQQQAQGKESNHDS
ncbi:MAG: endonuclease domain-containing protein [Methylococcaceae bacterium]|nr:endonuclease domain-containing protein [Methylococcaceae bacterium]